MLIIIYTTLSSSTKITCVTFEIFLNDALSRHSNLLRKKNYVIFKIFLLSFWVFESFVKIYIFYTFSPFEMCIANFVDGNLNFDLELLMWVSFTACSTAQGYKQKIILIMCWFLIHITTLRGKHNEFLESLSNNS